MGIVSSYSWRNLAFGHGVNAMRCLSCNCNLSDREANRKYDNHEEIKNPESRYIGLCDDCILDTDLTFVENPHLSSERYADEVVDVVEAVEDEFNQWSER